MVAFGIVLLAVTSPASGECTRVMWSQGLSNGKAQGPYARAGYATAAECRAALKKSLSTLRKRGYATTFGGGDMSGTAEKAKTDFQDLNCLPDTVDPRAPKGGGR